MQVLIWEINTNNKKVQILLAIKPECREFIYARVLYTYIMYFFSIVQYKNKKY